MNRQGQTAVALIVLVAAGLGGWFLTRSPASTQTPSSATADGRPDWSGAWLADAKPSVLETDAELPLTADYAAQLAKLRADVKAGGALPGNPNCRPIGLPLYMSHSGPLYEFLITPKHVFINAENNERRDIHTDGRMLPEEADLDAFNGLSAGRWEGDTLVIETISIHADVPLFPGIENGGGLRVTERLKLVGPDTLQDEITLTGAKALSKPYTYTTTFTRHREWAVAERVCLSPTHAIYKVEGYNPTADELAASTDAKSPIRQKPAPAANAASLPGGTWESIAKLPDWLGLWGFDNRSNEIVTGEYVPFTKPYRDYMKQLYAIRDVGGDTPSDVYHCRPRGAPQMMKAAGAGFYFAYTPGQVTMVPYNGQTRRFYTDGRPHPDNVELSFYGHSIAHWDKVEGGDALIVDTVAMRPDIQMAYGVPAGDGLHMVERIHLIAPDKMEFVVTQDSKVALLAPWTYNRTFTRHRDWELLEDYCSQNNRDVGSDTGMQTFDLTPPPEEKP